MNKVININFQGRVIPIEEPAYEELKKYVESLRAHFANEEGKEEIINDIENRIAELFSEKLKTGDSPFIAEQHVLNIIASIGRPEQFDEVMIDDEPSVYSSQQEQKSGSNTVEPRGSLYRNANDKLLGGVCSGLANYFRIDTTIVRVLFAVLTVGSFGTGFLLYVILWAILPSKEMIGSAIARKLYRNAEQKVLGGVCSGIAKYFNIAVWIPRLIFALPLLMGIFEIPFKLLFFPLAASFSGTMFFIYIILWAVVPKAVTASEKLEMSGERVDLESIKNKVQDDLNDVKKNISAHSENWKKTASNKATEFSQEVKEAATRFSKEASPAIKSGGSTLGRVIVAVFKVFIFFVLSVIAIALIVSLFAFMTAGIALMPLKNFAANGHEVELYGWGIFLFFLAVPVVGLAITLVRKIIGRKSKNLYLRYSLLILWLAGCASLILFFTTISKEFSRMGSVRNEMTIVQPTGGRLKINFKSVEGKYYPLRFSETDDEDVDFPTGGIRLSSKEDSMLISNIKPKIIRSRDDSFHVTIIRRARASSTVDAEKAAEQISIPVSQTDSVLTFPMSFPITTKTKFRNQQVIVQIEVPVGREIYIDEKADRLSWFSIKGGVRGLVISSDDEVDVDYFWRPGVWYIMKEGGIEKKYPDQEESDDMIEKLEEGIRKELKNEKMELENFELNIKDGDTSINVKIQSKPIVSLLVQPLRTS
jgi:phage shock protein PspC (stress-responsive transcriptional regulator)/CHASE3 domain sensor protein